MFFQFIGIIIFTIEEGGNKNLSIHKSFPLFFVRYMDKPFFDVSVFYLLMFLLVVTTYDYNGFFYDRDDDDHAHACD